MSEVIASEAQDLSISSDTGGLVTLFDLEMRRASDGVSAIFLYFHGANTEEDIQFDGRTYSAFPMLMEGIENTSDGALNRPSLTLPNVESMLLDNSKMEWLPIDSNNDGTIDDYERFRFEDLIGKRVIRHQTLSKYILEGSGTSPSPAYEFPKAIFVIDRIATKTSLIVQVELASPLDLSGARVPARQVNGKYCPWVYKQWTLSNTDVRSACWWKNLKSKATNTGDLKVNLFFTIDDEPLVLETLLSGVSNWASGQYAVNTVVRIAKVSNPGSVVSNYDYYQVKEAIDTTDKVTQAGHPTTLGFYWRRVRIFSEYSSTKSEYTVDNLDVRESEYVYKNKRVYKAIRANGTSIPVGAKDPTDRDFWVEADVCGKLLNSCKSRYQCTVETATPLQTADSEYHGIPSATLLTTVKLPFGGFPGTRKFR